MHFFHISIVIHNEGFDKRATLLYSIDMFVSVVLDPGQLDSARSLSSILAQYGFEKKQRACWEHNGMDEKKLGLLKKDIDRVTDYYDSVRLYQYPIDGMLVITELQKKKWKKCMLRSTER